MVYVDSLDRPGTQLSHDQGEKTRHISTFPMRSFDRRVLCHLLEEEKPRVSS